METAWLIAARCGVPAHRRGPRQYFNFQGGFLISGEAARWPRPESRSGEKASASAASSRSLPLGEASSACG